MGNLSDTAHGAEPIGSDSKQLRSSKQNIPAENARTNMAVLMPVRGALSVTTDLSWVWMHSVVNGLFPFPGLRA